MSTFGKVSASTRGAISSIAGSPDERFSAEAQTPAFRQSSTFTVAKVEEKLKAKA
jgi:hypothetical protein